MNMEKGVEALEARLPFDPITLLFEDGSSAKLAERSDYVMRLCGAFCRGEHSPKLDLIARSVSSEEPGGGHILDLIRAVLNSPAEVPANLSGK
jgi:hypothetical protein